MFGSARLAGHRALTVGLAAAGLAVSGLAACGSPAPAAPVAPAPSAAATSSAAPKPAAASPLQGADWAKVTNFHCPLDDQQVVVDKAVYGDITGDGVADAVVSLTCSTTTSSNPLRVEAFDGASTPAHPRSLGVLVSETDPIYVEQADVTIAHPTITLSAQALGPDAAMAAGPQVKFTQTFTYRDGTLRSGPRKTS